MREINKIILHCSATPEGQDVTAEDIDGWHKGRGWAGIGYHFVIRRDGTIEAGRNPGAKGAHCLHHNSDSIGVCYVGGLDKKAKRAKDTRTEEQKESLVDLITWLRYLYGPLTVHGHNEFSDKDCPCFDVRSEYKDLDSPGRFFAFDQGATF